MKNRKTASLHDNLLLNKLESQPRSYTDLRAKKKVTPTDFLRSSAKLLKNSNVFHKNRSWGDADAYFKQSLRQYDYFNVSKKLSNVRVDDSVSFESIKEFKRKVAATKGSGDQKHQRPPSRKRKGKSKLISEDSKEEAGDEEQDLETEEETDVFYSPNSESFRESKEESEMAEGAEEEEFIPIEEDEGAEEGVAEGEDVFGGVEQLVEQAANEMNEVIEENPEIVLDEGVEEEEEEEEGGEAGAELAEEVGGTVQGVKEPEPTPVEEKKTEEPEQTPSLGPEIVGDVQDSAVLKEVEECEEQCMEIYGILNELKTRVGELLSKPTRTEQEDKELAEKQKLLNEKMILLEQKTRRIEMLVGRTKAPPVKQKQRRYEEDILPKVLICGMADNNMPKIIVCDNKVKGPKRDRRSSASQQPKMCPPCVLPPADISVMPQFAKRLSESYCMQERLAAENADLEGKRYQLQEDLLDKDQTVESLQRKLNSLTAEMRMVVKENTLLNDKLCKIQNCPIPCSKARGDSDLIEEPQKKMPCGKGKGTCPADVETRLQEYGETTQVLERQLNDMENEVKNMQNELLAVQKERMHLEQHRKMLNQPPPCAGPPCMQPPCMQPPCVPTCLPPSTCPGPCNPNRAAALEMQLRELREQYNRLQEDYKGKLTEVAGLRTDTDKLKNIAKECEEYKKISEDKIKELEKELKGFKNEKSKFMGSKEQLVEQEQQLAVAKQRYREAQDELEELRALVEDQQSQLDDYRNKYLQAQQQVEEQRRQMDMMELENNRISEQVNLEIQRVKNQFQEKLQELTPLPDILKTTQIKLQEAQQMHLLAERNNEALVRELQAYRDKAAAMANQMEKVRSDQQLGADEKMSLQSRMEEMEKKLNEMIDENERLKSEIFRLEEVSEDAEKRAQEKLHEIAQLQAEIENVREESARQVARTKDRCETVRRSMQNQIADMERQLAQSRAQARQAQKDRDEIRQKMQAQINNLNENFEDAQMRIRNLQGHVNFLKNSYSNVFPPAEQNLMMTDTLDPCNCGSNF